MRKFFILLMVLVQMGLSSAEYDVYCGPHFNYTRLDFDNPSDLEGYMGGVTVGGAAQCGCLFTSVEFEGYWNAGPITGLPCERSSLCEYFTEWKLGGQYYACNCSIGIKPYVGFGWDQFKNEQDPQGQSLTYRYDKLFVPVGLMVNWFANDCFNAGFQFEWRPDVYSRVRFSSFEFKPECEHAFRVQLPFEATYEYCCRCINLKIVPFFDWNQFGEVCELTPLQQVVVLSQLTRWNLGLRVLLGCHF